MEIRGRSLICWATDKQEDIEVTAKLFITTYKSRGETISFSGFFMSVDLRSFSSFQGKADASFAMRLLRLSVDPRFFPFHSHCYYTSRGKAVSLQRNLAKNDMNIKRFIDRPLLSIVINVMVVAVGIIALTRLPIEKFPDIAPPTVYLWASYPGASAETVQNRVVQAQAQLPALLLPLNRYYEAVEATHVCETPWIVVL